MKKGRYSILISSITVLTFSWLVFLFNECWISLLFFETSFTLERGNVEDKFEPIQATAAKKLKKDDPTDLTLFHSPGSP